jgi:hypothetical protein
MSRFDQERRLARACLVPFILALATSPCWADDGFARDSVSHCSVFKPNLKPGEAVSWTGVCVDGLAQGQGKAKWSSADGSSVVFEGNFVQGKLQGNGAMSASGGDRYQGAYKDGKRDGRGIYVSANGDKFEGEYKENQRNGLGVFTPAKGLAISGEWRGGIQAPPSSSPSSLPSPPVITQSPRLPGPEALSSEQKNQLRRDEHAARQAERQAQYDARQAELQGERARVAAQRASERQTQQALAQTKTQDLQRQQQLAAQEQQRRQEVVQQATAEQQRQLRLAQDAAQERQRVQQLLLICAALALPIVLGGLVALLKWPFAVVGSQRGEQWISSRYAMAREATGWFSSFLVLPILWCLKTLNEKTASISDSFVKAGVRLALSLYLAVAAVAALDLLVTLTIWVTVWAVGLYFLGLGLRWFLIHHGFYVPRVRRETQDIKMSAIGARTGRMIDTTGLLDHQVGRTDAEGRIFDTTGIVEKQTHRIDSEGRLFDTSGLVERQIGQVRADGRVFDTTELLDRQIGRIAADGRVFDTTGLVERQIGLIAPA